MKIDRWKAHDDGNTWSSSFLLLRMAFPNVVNFASGDGICGKPKQFNGFNNREGAISECGPRKVISVPIILHVE